MYRYFKNKKTKISEIPVTNLKTEDIPYLNLTYEQIKHSFRLNIITDLLTCNEKILKKDIKIVKFLIKFDMMDDYSFSRILKLSSSKIKKYTIKKYNFGENFLTESFFEGYNHGDFFSYNIFENFLNQSLFKKIDFIIKNFDIKNSFLTDVVLCWSGDEEYHPVGIIGYIMYLDSVDALKWLIKKYNVTKEQIEHHLNQIRGEKIPNYLKEINFQN